MPGTVEMSEAPGYTAHLNRLLDRWSAGDEHALSELVIHAEKRLRHMASRMLANKPHVARWHQTDDVLQESIIRLHRSLKDVKPDSKRAFNGLAAQQIRRELCDMARSLYGPRGLGRHHKTEARSSSNGDELAQGYEAVAAESDSIDSLQMGAFHEAVSELGAEEKEVFELVFYQGMSQADVAELLGVSDRTIKRRFRTAKLNLSEILEHDEKKNDPTFR